MNDESWHSELLAENEWKTSNKEVRECCLAIALGQMTSLRGDIHIGDFHGRYDIPIDFCPYCGKFLRDYRELVWKKYKEALENTIEKGNTA